MPSVNKVILIGHLGQPVVFAGKCFEYRAKTLRDVVDKAARSGEKEQ